MSTEMKVKHTHGRADRDRDETDVEYVVDTDDGQVGGCLGCVVRDD